MLSVRKCAVMLYAALLGCSLLALSASGDEIAEAGKQIAGKWQNAIVTVQVVVNSKMSYQGEEGPARETKAEAVGSIIDQSGLVVTSLTDTDPDDSYEDMMDEDFSISSEVTDVKILLGNGQELPARIVLRDKEMDLAFIRPKEKPAISFTALDLSKGTSVALMDQVLALSRQAAPGGRTISVSVDRIESVMEKPRTYYIPDQGIDYGSVVFAMNGNIVGIALNRTLPSASPDDWYDYAEVIIPAADILEAAKQAPQDAPAD